MTKLTLTTIQKITCSSEFKRLQSSLIHCREEARAVRQRVLAYSEPLFQKYRFTDTFTGELITESKYSYCAVSDDPAMFDNYYQELHKLHLQNGFNVVEVGHCPALKAENAEVKAENDLLRFMEVRLGMPEIVMMNDRKTAIELYLKLKTR
jgi:hypothetical protein